MGVRWGTKLQCFLDDRLKAAGVSEGLKKYVKDELDRGVDFRVIAAALTEKTGRKVSKTSVHRWATTWYGD